MRIAWQAGVSDARAWRSHRMATDGAVDVILGALVCEAGSLSWARHVAMSGTAASSSSSLSSSGMLSSS